MESIIFKKQWKNFKSSLRIFGMLYIIIVYTGYNEVQAQLAKSCPKYLGSTWADNTAPYAFNNFNQVSPENSGKWEVVEPERNKYVWRDLDAMYDYCQKNNIPFKLHTFVWGNQKPNWIDGLSPADQKAELLEFMTLCAQRYPNVAMIDVVNEPLPNHAPPSFKNAIGGDNNLYGTGWDWIVWSFENARRLFPNAKLILNEYHLLNDYPIDHMPGRYTLEMYLEIVNVLKSRGLIDGIGDQSHFYETTNWNDLTARWGRLEAAGVPIYITEFDVNIADDNAQAARFKALYQLWWNSSAVKGITLWDYLQGHTWQPNAHLLRYDNSERPAMVWLKNYMSQQCNTGSTPVGPAGYIFAASEYNTVSVSGKINIAYGANGSFNYLYNQTSNVGCNTASFGGTDPAPGVVKNCFTQAAIPTGPSGYTYATGEYTTVPVTGTMNIAYGANGSFTYLYNQTSNVGCTVAAFGGKDPAPGIVKSCFTMATTPVGPAGYTYATGEYTTVPVSGTMNIAYGANGSYKYLYNQTSNVGCNVAAFGGNDPAPGIVKSCFTMATTPVGPAGYTYATGEYTAVPVSGTMNIAYGANGSYKYLYNQTSNVGCNVAAFGGNDPAPGIVKSCFTQPAVPIGNACINPSNDAAQYVVRNDWADQNSGAGISNASGAMKITQRQWGESILWVIATAQNFNITAGHQYTISFDYQDDNTIGLASMEVAFVNGYSWNGPNEVQPRIFTAPGFSNSYKNFSATITAANSGSVNLAFKLTWNGQPASAVNAYIKNIKICSNSSSFKTGTIDAADVNSAPAVSAYPNPSTGYATIQVPEHSTVKVIDGIGNVVAQKQSDLSENVLLDLTAQPAGIYVVQIITNGETTSQRLILQK